MSIGFLGCGIDLLLDSTWPIPQELAAWSSRGSKFAIVVRLAGQSDSDENWGSPIGARPSDGRFTWNGDTRVLECRTPRSASALLGALRLACAFDAWERNRLLLHSAGLLLTPEKAVIALAPSEGGKSTLTDLSGLPSLSDETVLVDLGPPVVAFGLPFRSTAKAVPTNATAALGAFLFLEKSKDLDYSPLPKNQAVRRLIPQIYTPPGARHSPKEILRRASKLVESVPTLRFRFPKSAAVADCLKRLRDELPAIVAQQGPY